LITHSLLKRNCLRIREDLASSDYVTIIHHWDTDGIASAVLLSKLRGGESGIKYVVPRIGEYSLTAFETNELVGYVVITDYGIKLEEVSKLSSLLGNYVAVIDHHLNRVSECNALICNPVAFGVSEYSYPSTTWVIKDLINTVSNEYLVALGIVGDVGSEVRNEGIRKWLSRLGLSINDLILASKLIDSCYKLIDYGCIDYARNLLMKSSDLGEVISDSVLNNALSRLSSELSSVLSNSEPSEELRVGDLSIKLFRLSTEYYLTSSIGRELARRYRDSVVVLINDVRRLGKSYIYVRSYTYNLRNVLTKLKELGLRVGGKDTVFVVTCSESSCSKEVSYVLNSLRKYVISHR